MEAPLPKQDTNELYLAVPLPHSRCTRIIEILDAIPGEASDLQLRLSVTDVDKWDELDEGFDNRIAALSYTWGAPFCTPECEAEYGPENDAWIQVMTSDEQRHIHRIGRNLYDALIHIQASKKDFKYLWVDALCIKQDDLHEKTQQVLLMDKIYAKASIVLVWLGVRNGSPRCLKKNISFLLTELAPRLNDYHGERGEFGGMECLFTGPLVSPSHIYFKQLGLNVPSDALHALYFVFARCRYFARAWICQEIVLSTSCTLLIGYEYFDWSSITLLAYLFRPYTIFCEQFADTTGPSSHHLGLELCTLCSIKGCCESLQCEPIQGRIDPYRRSMQIMSGLEGDCVSPHALFEFLLTVGHQKVAADPRDVIYSVNALTGATLSLPKPLIEPDYGKSVQEVYVEVTKMLLFHMPRLSILSLVLASSKEIELPSWVPDFSTCKMSGIDPISMTCAAPWLENPGFEAADKLTRSSIAFEGDCLQLEGRPCFKIRKVFKPFTDFTHPINPYLEKVRRIAFARFVLTTCPEALGTLYPTGESILEAIFRVITLTMPVIERSESLAQMVRFNFLRDLLDLALDNPKDFEIFDLLNARAGEWGIPRTQDIAWAQELIFRQS